MMATRITAGCLVIAALAGSAMADPAVFATPEEAVEAVVAGLEAVDRDEILRIFGPESEDMLSTGDREEDRRIWGEFLADAQAFREVVEIAPGEAMLYVGEDPLPFPIALLQGEAGWAFDTDGAREEIRIRRILRNEGAVIGIMGRAAEIQRDYRRTDHDGDGVMEFAAAILSSPGQRDGLYWPDAPGTPSSPFGAEIARSSLTGYSIDGADVEPEPLEGYFFQILQGQGPAAPGGSYSYLIGGNMVAGHALAAFPAVYGETGTMSFMVGENGVVYEADLGADTLVVAEGLTLFDPDARWAPVELAE